MSIQMIVGMQWGDEGKGKVIDQLTPEMDYIVRFQGGANAGHTVVVGEQEYVLHLLPSGVLHADKVCVIGNGVVLDPAQVLKEIREVQRMGFSVTAESLRISDRAHMVMPYHKIMDEVREEVRDAVKLGTTKRGIGPAYADKASRLGLRVCDMYHPDYFAQRVRENVNLVNSLILVPAGRETVHADEIIDSYLSIASELKEHVGDTALELNQANKSGKNILMESAQGAMLDIDFGTYPFVTSSNAGGGAVFAGCGITHTGFEDIIGILKAYTTRVGTGPFPTELEGETGDFLRKEGGEFGATTGRPRRCGWQDIVAARYTAMISGVTSIALTKLDVLSNIETIRVCTGYQLDGEVSTTFPAFVTEGMQFNPVYEDHPGWMSDLSGIREYQDLPENARKYVEALEKYMDLPVRMISTGRRRGEMVYK